MPSIDDVKRFWEENPLYSYELDDLESNAFFDLVDKMKREDIERFAMGYWDFEGFAGKRVLDVGCGPGWYTVQYAQGGAEVHAIDITQKAVDKTRRHLAYRGLSGTVSQGNAEAIAYPDSHFDLVASSGVLHHTPDCEKAIAECFRVTKPGGRAKLTFYRKGILHSPLFWGPVKLLMRLTGYQPPGADITGDTDADDLIRQYDGRDNPVGIGKTDREWARIMRRTGFTILWSGPHFMPRRFLPKADLWPVFLHRFMDTRFGTMLYLDLEKPSTAA